MSVCVNATRGTGLLVLVLLSAACSSDDGKQRIGVDQSSASVDGGVSLDAGASAGKGGKVNADAGKVPTLSATSAACGQNLPFQPPGCTCESGTSAACWTGPITQRNKGNCHDGTQQCVTTGEFSIWGDCEGEETDCGDDAPPPQDCPCNPGYVIGCDEDCAAFVFCAPTSSKECQPDGTWGPCRETIIPNAEAVANGCINFFHGCLSENFDGTFIGLTCGAAYTCGSPPGGFSLPDGGTPPSGGSTVDASAPAI